MTAIMAGKVALILGDSGEAGVQIAQGLADAGAWVGFAGPSSMSALVAETVDLITREGGHAASTIIEPGNRESAEKGVAAIAEALAPIDLVVLPVVDPGALVERAFVDLDEAEWMRLCEAPLRAVRVGLQAAHAALRERGGRILLLVPSIAITGAEGLAAYSAVGEGARSLAKAAARKWGALGITINSLGLLPEQLCPGAQRAHAEVRVPQALGHTPDLKTEVAPFIAMLATAPAGIATGSTIMLDGGNLMTI